MSGIATIILARNIYWATVSRRWETFPATIVGVGYEEGSDSNFHLRYYPQIRYKYNIDGETHYGERYQFGNKYYTKRELDLILNSLSIGQEKDIRVNPQKPQQSVIVPGAELADIFLIAGCLYLFILTFLSIA